MNLRRVFVTVEGELFSDYICNIGFGECAQLLVRQFEFIYTLNLIIVKNVKARVLSISPSNSG